MWIWYGMWCLPCICIYFHFNSNKTISIFFVYFCGYLKFVFWRGFCFWGFFMFWLLLLREINLFDKNIKSLWRRMLRVLRKPVVHWFQRKLVGIFKIKINCISADMESCASTDSHGNKPMISYEDVMIHTKSKSRFTYIILINQTAFLYLQKLA